MAIPTLTTLTTPANGATIHRTAGLVRFAWTASSLPDPLAPDAPATLTITAVAPSGIPNAPTLLTIEEA